MPMDEVTKQRVEKIKADTGLSDLVPLAKQTIRELIKAYAPVVGPWMAAGDALAQETEMKNLLANMDDLQQLVQEESYKLSRVKHDPEKFARLVHNGMGLAVDAATKEARHRTMRAVRNAMLNGVTDATYDNQLFFVKAAAQMFDIDASVLVVAHKNRDREHKGTKQVVLSDLLGVENDYVSAAISRLSSLGFVISKVGVAGQGRWFVSQIESSELGKLFVEFALDDVESQSDLETDVDGGGDS